MAEPKTQAFRKNENFRLSTLIQLGYDRHGYTFLKWRKMDDGATLSDGQVVNLSSEQVNLSALWNPNTYKTTFNFNGGSSTISAAWYRFEQSHPYYYYYDQGCQIGISNYTLYSIPFKAGYGFSGYKATDNKTYVDQKGTFINNLYRTYYQNTTLTAQWTPNNITVSFDGNGHTGGSMTNQTFLYGVAQNLKTNGFRREYTITYQYNNGQSSSQQTVAYTFNGWNNNKSGTGQYTYSNGQSVTNPNNVYGGQTTLYAKWTPTSIELPTPDREGHTFDGWYSDSSLTQKVVSPYKPTQNVTLYAKWTEEDILKTRLGKYLKTRLGKYLKYRKKRTT